ncbi:TIGR04282 family arsenosugar biosynthesis glycosyltransferase [Hymenobacter qilianensis]|nr:TIGR04282 family arsenosugar biosynthesis glycosyltransferase [Hymenobacter qilianensis]
MQHAFTQAFAVGATSVVIIGTDCPGLTTALLSQAFERLATHDVVVGPAADGGYYLLGMNTLHPALFQQKAWSTASVLHDTLADAARLGLQVARLPTMHDVDTADDLAVWRAAENQAK